MQCKDCQGLHRYIQYGSSCKYVQAVDHLTKPSQVGTCMSVKFTLVQFSAVLYNDGFHSLCVQLRGQMMSKTRKNKIYKKEAEAPKNSIEFHNV